MMDDERFQAFVRDRLVRIESKLSALLVALGYDMEGNKVEQTTSGTGAAVRGHSGHTGCSSQGNGKSCVCEGRGERHVRIDVGSAVSKGRDSTST